MKSASRINISQYFYYGLMLFLPLWLFIDNIFLILLFTSTIFSKKEKINSKNLLFHSLIVFTFYILMTGVFSNKFLEEINNYIKIIPLVLIPISIMPLTKKELEKGLFFLLLGILIMQIIALYGIMDYYFFSEGKKIALRSYAKVNDVLKFERPYVGFFSSLGLIISYYLFKNRKYWLILLPAAISVLVIIIISARLAVMIVFISAIVIVLHEIKSLKYKLTFVASIILLGVLMLKLSDTPLQHRFSEMKYDARIIIWKGASNIFEMNSKYIFGLGGQQEIRHSLLNYYKTSAEFEYPPDKTRFINQNYNTHNQYLNELLRGGVIGLFLYIIPFMILIYGAIKTKNILSILLLFSIVTFSIVENILDRQMGVYVVALIISLASTFINEKI